jgi:hypothetical protein
MSSYPPHLETMMMIYLICPDLIATDCRKAGTTLAGFTEKGHPSVALRVHVEDELGGRARAHA